MTTGKFLIRRQWGVYGSCCMPPFHTLWMSPYIIKIWLITVFTISCCCKCTKANEECLHTCNFNYFDILHFDGINFTIFTGIGEVIPYGADCRLRHLASTKYLVAEENAHGSLEVYHTQTEHKRWVCHYYPIQTL